MDVQVSSFTPQDKALVKRLSQNLGILETELNMLFPERSWLIRQTLLCLVLGKNLMIYGTHGTAKTKIVETIFDAITGNPSVFKIQLDMESTEEDVIGPLDIPSLEKGIRRRNVEGFLPTSNFALVDEWFEAPSVNRQLNDVFNEHVYMGGGQLIKDIPLYMAIATTNRSPEEILGIYPTLSLQSTNDRFLCVSQVNYLEDVTNMDTMMINFVTGVNPVAKVAFEDIQAIVKLLASTNQYPDATWIRVLREILHDYETKAVKKGLAPLSDRRLNWMTQVVEASAVLNGRTELMLDDILTVKYALAPREDSDENILFVESATKVIERVRDDLEKDVAKLEKLALGALEQKVGVIENKMADPNWKANVTPSIIGNIMIEIAKAQSDLDTLNPSTQGTKQAKEALVKRVAKIGQRLQKSLKP